MKFDCHFSDTVCADSIAGLNKLCQKYSAADKISAARLINGFSALILYLTEHHLISDNYKETYSSTENTVKSAIKFIQNNYHKKITLDLISDELYVNKFYLCKIFRHYTGMSVVTYVNELRLTQARLLLQEGQKVSEVCEKCGFTGQSYFTRLYKKRYNILPSESIVSAR
ncbi:MAG: helix-turn-helix transcriptional regulator [Candidatus Flemingiibacterium sp.]